MSEFGRRGDSLAFSLGTFWMGVGVRFWFDLHGVWVMTEVLYIYHGG